MYKVMEEKAVYIADDKIVGIVEYPLIEENVVDVCRAYVDEEFRSLGIARKLLEHAFEYFYKNNIKVVCTCRYAINWINKHPEYKILLKD